MADGAGPATPGPEGAAASGRKLSVDGGCADQAEDGVQLVLHPAGGDAQGADAARGKPRVAALVEAARV